MKKILVFLKRSWAVLLLFFIWLPITFYNTKIYWMLVDDGDSVVFARKLFEKMSTFNLTSLISQLLEINGRFRPVYWIYHMIVWLIGGNSFQFHHFAHMLVIGATVLFIYLIIDNLVHSKVIAFFGALFFLLIPLNTENIMRLGPQEPLLAMFLSILFYLAIQGKRIFLPCLFLVLAIFTKETSVALLPVFLFYYLFSKSSNKVKNKRQSLNLFITIIASSVLMILMTFLKRGGYSTNYYFNVTMMVDNLIVYFKELCSNTTLVFPIFAVIYLLRIISSFFKKQKFFTSKLDLFEFLFFVSFICFIVILLPWKYALSRYLMPAGLFLVLSSFLEIYRDINYIGRINFVIKYKQIFKYASLILSVYVFLIWGIIAILKETPQVTSYDAFAKMAAYPQNTILLMNMKKGEGTIELVLETQIHLSEFWSRGDIKVKYLDLNDLPRNGYIIVDSDQFPRAYQQDILNSLYKNKPFSIKNMSRRLVLTTPMGLVKQIIKKMFSFLVHRSKFTSEGIYTYYYNYNNWYFYQK